MEKPSVWRLVAWWPVRASVREFFVHYCCPGGGASDRDRDLGGATLLSSPTTISSTATTNIGASVTKQSHQPLTVHVNQRWQLLITTPEVDEQSHKLWVLPSLWKRDWVCALLAPSTLSWVRLCTVRATKPPLCTVHCARQTVRATKNGEKLPSRKEKASEGKLDAARNCVGRATRRHNSARKGLLKNLTL